MSTRGDRDAAIDRLLRTSLRGGSGGAGVDCPPPDILAAYVEGSLAAAEREAAEAHLAACEPCQQALGALAAMPQSAPARTKPGTRPAWTHLRWLVPAATVLTMLIVYVAVKPQNIRSPESAKNAVTTASRSAEQGRTTAAEGTQPAASNVAPIDVPPATPVPGIEAKPRQPSRTNAKAEAAPAAPPPQVAADATEAKPGPPAAAPQMADTRALGAPAARQFNAAAAADNKVAGAVPQVVAKAAAGEAARAAEGKEQRLDAIAESVAVSVEGSTFVVTSRDGRAQWRVEPRGVVLRSLDNGISWRQAKADALDGLLAASSPTATTAWVVGVKGTVLRTVDGEHWSRCAFPEAADLVAVDARDDRAATVVTRDGRRFATSDAGATWTLVR